MQTAVHRFVRLLRLHGVRIGVSEVTDAMTAAAVPGCLADRETLRSTLKASLVKDRRDLEAFEQVFDAFFALRPVVASLAEASHEHDDLSDEGQLTQFVLSDTPSQTPQQGHSHGPPKDIREYFRPEDLAQQYNLHQEANKLDLASTTNEVVLSTDRKGGLGEAARVQLSTRRLHNAGLPGRLIDPPGVQLDMDLSVAQEMALLGWLAESELLESLDAPDAPSLEELRVALAPLLAGLPETLKRHLAALMTEDGQRLAVERRSVADSPIDVIDEGARADLEHSVRRILHELHGASRPRRRVAARGVVDGRRTMRSNMRYDGVPFRPVTVARCQDRPQLVVLCDVSMSVRTTAAFMLHLVHSLQSVARSVRSFVFVDGTTEVTEVFADHHVDTALRLVMSGRGAGGLVDVDADSDYGRALTQFRDDYGSCLTRRATLLVLGDGRTNGRDPGLPVFADLAGRCRTTLWLTPEPRTSWGLGTCDLPRYAEYCDRVHVVGGPRSLEQASYALRGVGR